MSVIYIGPNVLSLGLQSAQVFTDGLPVEIEDAINKIPEVKSLIFPIEQLREKREKIKHSGSHESNLYKTIQKKAIEINAVNRQKRK